MSPDASDHVTLAALGSNPMLALCAFGLMDVNGLSREGNSVFLSTVLKKRVP